MQRCVARRARRAEGREVDSEPRRSRMGGDAHRHASLSVPALNGKYCRAHFLSPFAFVACATVGATRGLKRINIFYLFLALS